MIRNTKKSIISTNDDENIKTKENNKENDRKNSYNTILSDIFSLFIIILQIYICPFTKVEESFNLQAIHDIIYFKDDIEKYDHLEFPGVVPRTFLGALFIGCISSPIIRLVSIILSNQNTKLVSLYIVRVVLGIIGWFCFREFRKSVSKRFDNTTGILLNVITSCQFHFFFYISRPLPNIFALNLVLLGYSSWLKGEFQKLVVFLTISIFIFRSELLILAGPIILVCLLRKEISFSRFILIGLCVSIFSILTSIIVDSYFWQKPIYPELSVLYFNTIQNQSSNWGTLPWYWYVVIGIPKSLILFSFVFFYGLVVGWKRSYQFIVPILIFIGLYSILPHKEFRFIIYSMPIINLIVAIGFREAFSRYNRFIKFILLSIITFNLMASGYYLYVSSLNYYGGYSLIRLHQIQGQVLNNGLLLNNNMNNNNQSNMRIHIDNLAAINGVSRFSELNHLNIYDKLEHHVSFPRYTHLITPTISPFKDYGFQLLDSISGLDGMRFNLMKRFPYIQINILKKDLLFLFKNKNS